MELLTEQTYEEFEAFMLGHPGSSFTQSLDWWKVKTNWQHAGVISRGADGRIVGAVSLLIQRVPVFGTSMLYSPRGPVCDLHDEAVLRDLKSGIDQLARQYKAHTYKMDPDVPMSDSAFIAIANKLGFRQFYGPEGFETIQARFNYRLDIAGKTEEDVLANMTQKTRYNIRVAKKHGVQVRPVGLEYLDDFVRIMQVTGERDSFATRPRAYFERMLTALGEHVRLYMAFYEDQAVSGAIATNYGGKCCYVYGASDNVYRNVMPNYLVQWEMIRWALETGCTLYDFQGVSGNLDPENNHLYGLYRFKKGFNGYLDELAGEFDYDYRPVTAKLVKRAISINEALRKWKKGRK